MSRILITGATGFVGKALTQHLANQGHAVVAVVRKAEDKPPGADAFLVVPDIVDADWTGLLSGIDAIVHLAARVHVKTEGKKGSSFTQFMQVNRDATVALAKAAAAQGVKRFIFLSSVKAAVDHTGEAAVDESVHPDPHTPYGISKREAEQELMCIAADSGLAVVILRPPLVYGPGVKANFALLVRAVRLRLPLPFGAVRNSRSFLSLSNLLSAIDLALVKPDAVNRIFFLSDGDPLSTPQLMEAVGIAVNRRVRLVNVPLRIIRETAEFFGQLNMVDRLLDSLVVDNSAFRAATGWQPESMAAELERLVASLYSVKTPGKKGGKK